MPQPGDRIGPERLQQGQRDSLNVEQARWNLITELVGEAWNMHPGDREAFLIKACNGNPGLLNEVTILLSERESVSGFLESGVLHAERLTNGTRLGSYVIEDQIGEGGMGVVYRGRDERLGRDVAIKVVRFLAVPGQPHREQFLNEARTTAALNHPNIVTIYDVGSTADNDFIVMEYLHGSTLDRLLDKTGALKLAETLRIAEEIANALAYAHGKRIIHRDLKPGNIILTEDGTVKVLDFGLAKQPGQPGLGREEALTALPATASTMSTFSGKLAGTVSYMSPEQAARSKVDERSDLFSLGCVLFELITGRRAFQGKDVAETLAMIRRAEHPSVRELVPTIPDDLARVITSCLELDPQRRPQSALEVIAALTKAKSDAETRRRTFRYMVLAVLGGLLALGGWATYRKYTLRPDTSGRPLHALPLTGRETGEFTPSVSPDGQSVAYSAEASRFGPIRVFVKPVQGGEARALTGTAVRDVNPVWSPDGTRLAFLRVSESNDTELWTVASDDGAARKVTGMSAPMIDWTARQAICWPSNDWLIVSSHASPNEPFALYRVAMASPEQRRITTPVVEAEGDFNPQVSSDGRLLAFVRISTWNNSAIYIQPLTQDFLADGSPKRINTGALQPSSVTWSPQGDLIFTAGFADHSLWRIAPREGEAPQRLDIIGGDDGMNPSVSGSGTMAFTRTREEAEVWRLDLRKKRGLAPELLISSQSMNLRPQYSPNGQTVSFISLRSGYAEIWAADAEGRQQMPITARSDPSVGDPFWSPDGESLVFCAAPQGQYDIFRISRNGGTPVQITRDPGMDIQPSWSRDGQWIYFASNRAGAFHIYRVSSNGGEAVRATDRPGFASFESPDGKFLYFTDSDAPITNLWRLNKETSREESLNISVYGRGFAPAKDGVYFQMKPSATKRPEIWFLNLRDRTTQLIQKLDENVPPGLLSVSPDERFLLFTKYRLESHIMIVKGFH